MSVLTVFLTNYEVESYEPSDGPVWVMWDRTRDGQPAGPYYEPPFPPSTIFEGVEHVVFSESVMRAALTFSTRYGDEVRSRLPFYLNKGRWD